MNTNHVRALLTAALLTLAPTFVVGCAPEPMDGTPSTVIGDRDGDGTKDNVDKCPDLAGPGSNNGCPVTNMSGGEPVPATLTDAICYDRDHHYPHACAGECVTKVQDSLNCGACGRRCKPTVEACENSVCIPAGSAKWGAWVQNATNRTLNLTVGHTELGISAVEEQITLAPGAWWGNGNWTGVYASENPWKENVMQESLADCQLKFNGKGRREVVFKTNNRTGVGRCEFKTDAEGNL